MGLVKAALGAASGVMGDQWKEYFYCSALPAEVLAVKGQKKVSGRSSNRHGAENIITDGSIVAVAEGQCASSWSRARWWTSAPRPASTPTTPAPSLSAERGSGQEHRRGLC